MVVENSNDLLLIFGGIGALFASIMGAVRMSRCNLIRCGCCEIHRVIKGESPREPRETREAREDVVQV
jgi:hypothetical protein